MKVTPEQTHRIISDVCLPDVFPIVVDIERSEGNYLFDALSGKKYLDCFSYIASNPIGHNHPGMFEAEFEKKLLRVARTKPSCSDVYLVEFAEFVSRFRNMGMPAPFSHLFLVEGGAVAVENAMKAAFDWKVRLNKRKFPKEERGTKILHFEQAFHGRCGYTLSVTNTTDPKKTKFFPKFQWPRIVNPKRTFPLTPQNEALTKEREAEAEAQIRTAFQDNDGEIAAILIEPIQGEGGDNHFRPEFHQKLRALADEYQALLIYDEIQTGVGLTGSFWAYQQFGMTPDVICFGKKLQICGIIVGPRIDSVEDNVFVEKSRINSTWGGSLTDMVRATRYLEIIEAENLIENAKVVGELLQRRLGEVQGEFPEFVSNVRGLGLMCALDLKTVEMRDAVVNEMFKREVIVLKCGERSLRLRPSLVFQEADLGVFIDRLRESVAAVLARV